MHFKSASIAHLSLQNAGSNRKLPAEIRFKFGLNFAAVGVTRFLPGVLEFDAIPPGWPGAAGFAGEVVRLQSLAAGPSVTRCGKVDGSRRVDRCKALCPGTTSGLPKGFRGKHRQ